MAPARTLVLALIVRFALLFSATVPTQAAPVAVQAVNVCNAGTVPVVAFLAYDMGLLTEDWGVESTVIAPGKCGDIPFGTSVEFYLGFAVTMNGRLVGQPADNLPDSGMYRGAPLVQRTVKHVCLLRTGVTNYHYGVLEPDCATLGSNGPNRGQYLSVDTALFVRTGYDPRRELSGLGHNKFTVAPSATDPRLRLREGVPAGVEAAREAENDALVQKLLDQFLRGVVAEASKTPQQRSAEINHVSPDKGEAWTSPRLSAAGPFHDQWYGKTAVIFGTVSRVDLHGQFPTWITLYFKESPDNAIVVCSSFPDIFFERLGRGYATSLVGRAIEVQGIVAAPLCDPRAKGTVQISNSNQLRIK
ncbi:MAG TPA: hypothetical protein VN700_00200 [Vicinamibacterales bacterium]|nr:hypothetical protein [Vicinamibacterales bacterium]